MNLRGISERILFLPMVMISLIKISQYAKNAHVSKLVLGRSYQKPSLFRKTTLVDQLSKLAPEIEIYIIPDQQYSDEKKVQYDL